MDAADIRFDASWVGFLRHGGKVTLRLEATTGPADGRPTPPVVRAVVPIAVPDGTTVEQLAGQMWRTEAALGEATVTLQTPRSWWYVELSRLSIDHVGPTHVRGSMEGVATRGARGTRKRPFEMGFVAFRGPVLAAGATGAGASRDLE